MGRCEYFAASAELVGMTAICRPLSGNWHFFSTGDVRIIVRRIQNSLS